MNSGPLACSIPWLLPCHPQEQFRPGRMGIWMPRMKTSLCLFLIFSIERTMEHYQQGLPISASQADLFMSFTFSWQSWKDASNDCDDIDQLNHKTEPTHIRRREEISERSAIRTQAESCIQFSTAHRVLGDWRKWMVSGFRDFGPAFPIEKTSLRILVGFLSR